MSRKIDQKRRPPFLSDFGRTMRKLVEQGVYLPQEAVEERGHMAKLMKKRHKARGHRL